MAESVQITVLFFAKSREIVGQKEGQILISRQTTPSAILNEIVTAFPGLGIIKNNVILSLNEDYLSGEDQVELKKGDEIAVIPPISGGKDFVNITEAKLNVDEICDLVSSPSCGAVSVFIGTTRDNFEGKKVVQLEYEAYTAMAERKMREVCALVREKWDVHSIAIVHRIGVVPVKEASIVIAISSAHRKESLEAVHFSIDTVKAIVPVWKKEMYADESSSWKQNKECAWTENDSPCPEKSDE